MSAAAAARLALQLGRLLVDLGEGGVAARPRRRRRSAASSSRSRAEVARPGSAASRRSMTSSTTSSRSLCRRCSEAISGWRLSRSLGEETGAGVEPLLVAVGAGADRVDVLLGLGLLAGEVARLGLGRDHLGRRAWRSASACSSISASSGRVRRRWASRSRRSRARQVEQSLLGFRGCFHDPQYPLVQASVTVAETRVSTLMPLAAQDWTPALVEPGPFGGPVGGVDQRGPARLHELAGRVVPQVGGEEDVHARGARRGRGGSRPRRR